MLVKCQHCKDKRIDRDTAFVIRCGQRNLYYCNEEEWQQEQDVKKWRKALHNEIDDIFQYEVRNTALYKEWAVWNRCADNRELFLFLRDNYHRVRKAMRRDFSSEYGRIKYFSAFIKNQIIDFKNESKKSEQPQEPKVVEIDFEFYEPKRKKKKARRGLADVEEEIDVD